MYRTLPPVSHGGEFAQSGSDNARQLAVKSHVGSLKGVGHKMSQDCHK